MKDIYHVKLSGKAKRDLRKIPTMIAVKLYSWIEDIGHLGISEVRKIPGYHDEPLHGKRAGQRSIRLNQAYRAIYIIDNENLIRFIEIIEVTKHGY